MFWLREHVFDYYVLDIVCYLDLVVKQWLPLHIEIKGN